MDLNLVLLLVMALMLVFSHVTRQGYTLVEVTCRSPIGGGLTAVTQKPKLQWKGWYQLPESPEGLPGLQNKPRRAKIWHLPS